MQTILLIRHRTWPCLFIFYLLLSGYACFAQGASTSGLNEIQLKIDKILKDQFDENSPGYSILISKDGEVIYHKAAGSASLEMHAKMTPKMVFKIASLTKQFTAVAILQLMEAGKLSLKDPIDKFVEVHPNSGITIEHLLTHTSGIPDYTKQPYFNAAMAKKDLVIDDQIDLFKNDPLLFDPGTGYSYSNSGYALLGKVIEVVSKSSYSKYLEDNIIIPLGLEGTYYGKDNRIIQNRTRGYSMDGEGFKNATYLSDEIPYAGGALMSTTGDLFKWHRALHKGKVISKASLSLAHTPYLLKDGKSTGYGFGWQIGSFQDQKIVYHNGSINGFMADALYLPEVDVFIAMLTNCDCKPPGMYLSKIMPLFLTSTKH